MGRLAHSGDSYGSRVGDHPLLGIPWFIGYAVLVGIILGWLQLASGSVWLPALAHGSKNAAQRAALVYVTGYNSLVGGPLGSLVGWIVLAAFIGWIWLSGRLPVIPAPP